MEPYVVPLPSGVTIQGLDQAFSSDTVAGEDSNALTTTSRETLLRSPAGGPYSVSLYRRVSDRYHRRPCVTLAPTPDAQGLRITWADATERLFWTSTTGLAVVFAVAAIAFAVTISLLALVLLVPAVMMLVIGQRNYRSSSSVQRQDCEDAVAVALSAVAASNPRA